jgi:hypothetical protein
MDNTQAHDPGRLAGSPVDRLVRDLNAIERLDPDRPTAAERLKATLGDDLTTTICEELRRLNSTDDLVRNLTRRIA